MASEANTVSGAGADQGTLDMRNPGQGKHDQLPCVQSAPDQVKQWYGCYGARGDLFTQESNRHPAKMAVQLCYRIFEHGRQRGYWKPGDTILDPMGGIGTTGIVGASLGYNVLLLELEHHFLSMAAANICVLRTKMPSYAKSSDGKPGTGKISLLQGDARQLEEVLAQADAAITSPPYTGNYVSKERSNHLEAGRIAEKGLLNKCGRYADGFHPMNYPDAAIASPPYGDSDPSHSHSQGKSRTDPNSPNFRPVALRDWDEREHPRRYAGVVSSPVYGDTPLSDGSGVSWKVRQVVRKKGMEAAVRFYRTEIMDKLPKHGRWSDENIRRHIETALRTESGSYAGAVSSPPFLQAKSGGGINVKGYGDGSDKVGERTYSHKTAGTSRTQIGNLPDPKNDIDAVLSSPPWENVSQEKRFKNPSESRTFAKNSSLVRRGRSVEAVERAQQTRSAGYPSSNGQIGKQSGETYLSAMRQVYAQLHLVLRPSGVVCLVTKNPVKKGQIRRLDSDTIRLMEACGFTFLERQRAMLAQELGVQHRLDGDADNIRRERKSFFKRLFERKYPDLRVDHEDVLWFRKA